MFKKEEVDVSIKALTEDELVLKACAATTKDPDKKLRVTLEKLLECEHSPIRAKLFWIQLRNIPSFVATHFSRHSKHMDFLGITSNRSDRGGKDELGRFEPVNLTMLLNFQCLKDIARKRLCYQASKETVEVMKLIKEATPEPYRSFLVPECEYRNGCHELKPCGYYKENR